MPGLVVTPAPGRGAGGGRGGTAASAAAARILRRTLARLATLALVAAPLLFGPGSASAAASEVLRGLTMPSVLLPEPIRFSVYLPDGYDNAPSDGAPIRRYTPNGMN